jgi:hypothetical protein
MASWMVHLRLADNLLGLIDGLDEAQFGIGNVAPDAGIPDEKWENFSPSPEISHFRADREAAFPSKDLEFYRRYLEGLEWPNDQPQLYSFRLGYFFHLVTDNLWHVKIDQPTRVRYPRRFESDPDFVWEVKLDWYGLDFIFARDHPDAFFWRVFMESQYMGDYLDFMPVEAVKDRIRYIKDFYQRGDEKVEALCGRRFKFLTKEKMDYFVEKTTERLNQIYGLLREQEQTSVEGYTSALEIPV